MQQIKEFLRRNAPVFVVGGILLASFLLVIYLSQNRSEPVEEPELVVVESEEEALEFRSLEELTAAEISEISPEELERVLEEYGPNQGQYDSSFSLLPGNPGDEAINETREKFDELNKLNADQVQDNFGDVVIRYTEEGFEPQSPVVYIYQSVIWVNETEEPITLRQLTQRFPDWNNSPKTLSPGEQFEYQIPNTLIGKWPYEEAQSRKYGTLRIKYAIKSQIE